MTVATGHPNTILPQRILELETVTGNPKLMFIEASTPNGHALIRALGHYPHARECPCRAHPELKVFTLLETARHYCTLRAIGPIETVHIRYRGFKNCHYRLKFLPEFRHTTGENFAACWEIGLGERILSADASHLHSIAADIHQVFSMHFMDRIDRGELPWGPQSKRTRAHCIRVTMEKMAPLYFANAGLIVH